MNFKLLTIAFCSLFISSETLAQDTFTLLIPSKSFDSSVWEQIKEQESFTSNVHEVYARPKNKKPVLKFVRVSSVDLAGVENDLIKANLFELTELDAIGELASCTYPDPGFFRQWNLDNDGSRNGAVAGADISACEAWDITTGDSSVVVGFIDSGNRSDHPDLAGRVWVNPGEIPNNNLDDDNNGYVDDVYGWNTWQDNSNIVDLIGHGTQINGIVGSNPSNGTGFVGVDHACQLINVKGVNDQGQGLNSWWAEGVYYLVDNGADIINMSLTSYSQVQVLQDALEYAENNGVLVVAATGNDRTGVGYPAKYPTVFAVGATDHADNRALWSGTFGSNFGPEVDVVAPGKAIYGINHVNNSTQYVTAGTSQASPHVAAVASLLLAVDSSLTTDSLRAIIRRTAEDEVGLPSEDVAGFDNYHGYGRLNAYQALVAAMPDTTTQDTSTTGFSSLNNSNVSVYPNPTTGQVVIDGLDAGSYNISWMSVSGLIVKEDVFVSGENMSAPKKPGLYLMFISNNKGAVMVEKMVVR